MFNDRNRRLGLATRPDGDRLHHPVDRGGHHRLHLPSQGRRAGYRDPGPFRVGQLPRHLGRRFREAARQAHGNRAVGSRRPEGNDRHRRRKLRRRGAGIRIRLGQDPDHGRRARRHERRRGRLSRRRRAIHDQRDQLLRVSHHHRLALRPGPRTHAGPHRQGPSGPPRRAGAGARGRHRRQPRRDGRGGHRPAAARGLQRHRQRASERRPEQQPADCRRRGRQRPGRVLGQDPLVLRRHRRHLRPSGQDQWRPCRHAGRSGPHQPDLRGPRRHRPLQRRDGDCPAGGQAQGLQHHRHRRAGARHRGRGRGHLAVRASGRGAGRHFQRPVAHHRLHGLAARRLGADRHRAGDDRHAGRARHPPRPARGLRHPHLVPALLRAPGGDGRAGVEHRHVRPDPRRGHAGRRRHRGGRIRRQADRRGRRPDARLRGRCQAHVLAGGQFHRHHALRLPADALLARRAGAVHDDAARHAHLRAVGLAAGGARLPARHGRRHRTDRALVHPADRIHSHHPLVPAYRARRAGRGRPDAGGSGHRPPRPAGRGTVRRHGRRRHPRLRHPVASDGLRPRPRHGSRRRRGPRGRAHRAPLRAGAFPPPVAPVAKRRRLAGPQAAFPHGPRPDLRGGRHRRRLGLRDRLGRRHRARAHRLRQFFVDSEPENAIVYVRARGNLSIGQKDALVREAEEIVLQHPNVLSAFSFAGDGGLNNNTGGAAPPLDTIGQVQFELIKWEDRPTTYETWFTIPVLDYDVQRRVNDPVAGGERTIDELTARLERIPGMKVEILSLEQGPASAKPVHLRLKGDNWQELQDFTARAREKFEETRGLDLVEDTLPLPGIDWQIDVDVEKAGRFGADVATVGAMVQLVTRGILLDTMRVPSSDEEIDIRVRLPAEDRVLSTLDELKVRTDDGLVPLSNFITRQPVPKLAQIDRVDQTRYFDVKAAVVDGLTVTTTGENGEETQAPLTANERIETLTAWLESADMPRSVSYEWTGDAEDQEESGAFLQQAFLGALGLMFIILLAQFNSVYNAVLVLLAVILSTTGVLIGMLVMNQPFSIIMTGTGIVALAGIVVNNNIVLIDTYQEYSRYMPRIEAITRTAEARIRPVLLTTITTMAGLAPMMFGLSLDFFNGGYTFNSPTALWWTQLATAVVFGLGIATVLTLVFTPSMLALRIWATTYVLWGAQLLAKLSFGRSSRAARDWALSRQAARVRAPEIIWTEGIPDIAAYEDDTTQPELALDDVKGVLADRKAAQAGSDDDDDTPPKDKSLRAAE
ncbi:efflux RND transporter permease subunit [Roseovarius sp.]|uniref:efflux RND transporter permease subunit n=1 Tax=Roseovarius sp. TaxID=1486281 RepID=UPI003D0AB1AD